MYKNILCSMALTALVSPVMAKDAAPVTDATSAPAVEVAPEISPEKMAKVEKEMKEVEAAIVATGIDMTKQPTLDDIVKVLAVINPFFQRADLEPETVMGLIQTKMMLSLALATSPADLDTLKAELLAIGDLYPTLKAELDAGVAQMFAEGSEALFEALAPMRAQFAAPAEAPAPAATPAEAPTPAAEVEAAKAAAACTDAPETTPSPCCN